MGGFYLEVRILRISGHFVPHSKGRTMAQNYHHLSLAERVMIMSMRNRRMPVSRIAAELRRHPATLLCLDGLGLCPANWHGSVRLKWQ